MLKKLIIAVLSFLAIIPFTGCSSSDEPDKLNPVVAEGNWSEDPSFEASINNGNIEIWLIGDEARSLFWAGTFPADTLVNGDEIPSKADTERLSESLTGVGETSYTFKYDDDALQFEFIFGESSRMVHLTKE